MSTAKNVAQREAMLVTLAGGTGHFIVHWKYYGHIVHDICKSIGAVKDFQDSLSHTDLIRKVINIFDKG